MQWVLNSAASTFYEEAGSAAAALGMTVDIFAASQRTCGLHAFQPLASGSAGCLRLYPSLQQAPMPQVHPSARPLLKPPQCVAKSDAAEGFLPGTFAHLDTA